jgi:hypothetical protein
MIRQMRCYVVRVGNLGLMHRVAKACHMHGGLPDKTFEIASRYSYGLKAEWPGVKSRLEGFLRFTRKGFPCLFP